MITFTPNPNSMATSSMPDNVPDRGLNALKRRNGGRKNFVNLILLV